MFQTRDLGRSLARLFNIESLLVSFRNSGSHSNIGKLRIASLSLSYNLQPSDRIEQLKTGLEGALPMKGPSGSINQHPSGKPSRPSSSSIVPSLSRGGTSLSSQAVRLTPSEVSVLKRSSVIASGLFMPWLDEEVKGFHYSTPDGTPYKDPDGLLKLSDRQREMLHKWARPSEIMGLRGFKRGTKPVMIKALTPYSIRQRCVTDCSFIASLCICAAFERRFKRRLITSIVYPQDVDGMPIFNPHGKYMVKLWLNGVARRVIIDDFLPIDFRGNLLCSHTSYTFGLELWVAIIEKAYMKLCECAPVSACCPLLVYRLLTLC